MYSEIKIFKSKSLEFTPIRIRILEGLEGNFFLEGASLTPNNASKTS